MKNQDNPIYKDPDYVQGQIASLQALILGLAQMTTSREFREQSLERLEILKTTHLHMPVSELRLKAIEDCEAWVQQVTG